MSQSAGKLIKAAQSEGVISQKSAQALAVVDIGKQIQAGLGIPVDLVQASEVFLVTILIDDSGSIRFAGNSQAVRDGHNLVLDALAGSKQKDNILVHTRYLNGYILYPYCLLEQAIRMDSGNYDAQGGTPLYDETLVILGTMLAKTQEFAENNVLVKTATLVVSDGADEHSVRATPQKIAAVIGDLLKQETHIIAAMGIDDGGRTDFRQVFSEMGIQDEWILTPDNTESEIRRAFGAFSQSAVQSSQGVILGGFEAP
ncbi:MAG: hypothetical protein GTO16_10795 [Candidatus Aminicenantes bacterium]|nr:hypothetical protein [Candidatus Aminicenantes bacterium]